MTAEFVTAKEVKHPLPKSSTSIWNNADVLEGRKAPDNLFHALLEDTGLKNEHGRPIFNLSDKVGVNFQALLHNEAQRGHVHPLLSAYKKAIDAEPNKYIHLADLGNPGTEQARGLCMLHAQWVLFNQPALSIRQPQLFAMTSPHDGKFYLPGFPISSNRDLDNLHTHYHVIEESDFLGSTGIRLTGLFVMAGEEAANDARFERTRKSGNPSQRIALEPIDAAPMGLDGRGILLRENNGRLHGIPGIVHQQQGRLNLAQLGLVRVPKSTGKITCLINRRRGHSAYLLSPRMLHWSRDDSSPQIDAIADGLLRSGAWQRGVKGALGTIPRWIARNISHLGFGN